MALPLRLRCVVMEGGAAGCDPPEEFSCDVVTPSATALAAAFAPSVASTPGLALRRVDVLGLVSMSSDRLCEPEKLALRGMLGLVMFSFSSTSRNLPVSNDEYPGDRCDDPV